MSCFDGTEKRRVGCHAHVLLLRGVVSVTVLMASSVCCIYVIPSARSLAAAGGVARVPVKGSTKRCVQFFATSVKLYSHRDGKQQRVGEGDEASVRVYCLTFLSCTRAPLQPPLALMHRTCSRSGSRMSVSCRRRRRPR